MANTPSYTIDEKKQTVAGQLDGLLDSNSSYMQQAATAGTQYANKRGLLNSSLGAQASQQAAISAALPIAQQDASTHNAFAGQQYGAELTKSLNQQQQDFNLATLAQQQSYTQSNMNLQNSLQQQLNQQQQDFTQSNMQLGSALDQDNMRLQQQLTELQAQKDYARTLGQMDKAASINQQMAQLQQSFTQSNMQLQSSLNLDNLAKTAAANTHGAYLDAINEITNNAMVSINEIETAEGIRQRDKDKMIANTIARRNADLAWTRNLYSNMPTWDFSWIDTGYNQMPAAPGIA
jgi:hypothetical protein